MATILIADDHPDLRRLMVIQLQQHGFACLEATNGREALEVIDSESVDLILMDLNMPELDGWQSTAKIRSNRDHAGLPIVALTAYSMEGDRARALSAGCNAFYPKPVEFQLLLDEIQQLLSSSV